MLDGTRSRRLSPGSVRCKSETEMARMNERVESLTLQCRLAEAFTLAIHALELARDSLEENHPERAASERNYSYLLAAYVGDGNVTATPEILDSLAHRLRDEDKEERSMLLWIVGRILLATDRRSAVPPAFLARLLKLLRDEDGDVRRAAVWAIPNVEVAVTPETIVCLLALLHDEDGSVRGWAAHAFLGFEDLRRAAAAEILACLPELLRDKDMVVLRRAMWLLISMESSAATPEFLARLVELLHDEDAEVRWATVGGIGGMESSAVTPEILACLPELLRDEDSQVRGTAVCVVRDIGSSAVTPEILACLPELLHDPRLGITAISAVGEIGSMAAAREVLIRLVELLHDEDRRVRLAARVAVRKLRESATSEIRARLTELLGDKGIPTM